MLVFAPVIIAGLAPLRTRPGRTSLVCEGPVVYRPPQDIAQSCEFACRIGEMRLDLKLSRMGRFGPSTMPTASIAGAQGFDFTREGLTAMG